MSDHIIDNLNSDVALATALRNFLTTPAIIDLVRAVVTEAVNEEIQRLKPVTLSHLTDLVDNLDATADLPEADKRFVTNLRDAVEYRIERQLEYTLAYYVHEDDLGTKVTDAIDLDGKINRAISDQLSDELNDAIRDLRIVRRD